MSTYQITVTLPGSSKPYAEDLFIKINDLVAENGRHSNSTGPAKVEYKELKSLELSVAEANQAKAKERGVGDAAGDQS